MAENGKATSSDGLLLDVHDLRTYFYTQSGVVKAVDGVSISINEGETLGLVGESGCGKSTLGKSIVRLLKPNSGKIIFKGHNITNVSQRSLRQKRQDFQMVFQDPQSPSMPECPSVS